MKQPWQGNLTWKAYHKNMSDDPENILICIQKRHCKLLRQAGYVPLDF